MNERDHVSRNAGFRASIDGHLSAFTPRRRAPAPPPLTVPLAHTPNPPLPQDHPTPKTPKIMSFFSRFTSKSKSKPAVPSKHARGHSLPVTPPTPLPTIKHAASTPLFTPASFELVQAVNAPAEQFPLCIARIQAVEATSLPTCTVEPEKLLRREDSFKSASRRSRVLRHAPARSIDLDWTKKLFVLLPGLVLQYAGTGTEDRLPEKILPLTAGSLAFASDAIPGRPWVLQITTGAAVAEVASTAEKRSTFTTKAFRGTKENSPVLLLVFDCADGLDHWMGLIRAEAARLGGGVARETVLEVEEPGTPPPDRNSRRIVISREAIAANGWPTEMDDKRTSGYTSSATHSDAALALDALRVPSRNQTREDASPDTSPDRSERSRASSTATQHARSVVDSHTGTPSRAILEADLPPTPHLPSFTDSAATTPSGASTPHPLSAIDSNGNLYWIPQPQTPRANLPQPTFTPNPFFAPKPLPTPPAPRIRPISTPGHSRPPSVACATEPARVRPLSMFTTPSTSHRHSLERPREPRRKFSAPADLQRTGPPRWPPPSGPLPKLPTGSAVSVNSRASVMSAAGGASIRSIANEPGEDWAGGEGWRKSEAVFRDKPLPEIPTAAAEGSREWIRERRRKRRGSAGRGVGREPPRGALPELPRVGVGVEVLEGA